MSERDLILITGANGLVGSASARAFDTEGYRVLGIDDDTRGRLLGTEASTASMRSVLAAELRDYRQESVDIRIYEEMERLFRTHGGCLAAVVHCAGQPSHDWAAASPLVDFDINARGTLLLLELTRRWAPEATFVFVSTNKVYGDRPNALPLQDSASRFDLPADHPSFQYGIDETVPIDRATHSLFGVSKCAADLAVQEYGRSFGLRTVSFRAGCITGPQHSAVKLHGFLAYLVRCALAGRGYEVIGYGGRQVRDNLHARDLAQMFVSFVREPGVGEVYNVGGGRSHSCSVLEAVDLVERVSGISIPLRFEATPRLGDHKWYISDTRRFETCYPSWSRTRSLEDIVVELVEDKREGA